VKQRWGATPLLLTTLNPPQLWRESVPIYWWMDRVFENPARKLYLSSKPSTPVASAVTTRSQRLSDTSIYRIDAEDRGLQIQTIARVGKG